MFWMVTIIYILTIYKAEMLTLCYVADFRGKKLFQDKLREGKKNIILSGHGKAKPGYAFLLQQIICCIAA